MYLIVKELFKNWCDPYTFSYLLFIQTCWVGQLSYAYSIDEKNEDQIPKTTEFISERNGQLLLCHILLDWRGFGVVTFYSVNTLGNPRVSCALRKSIVSLGACPFMTNHSRGGGGVGKFETWWIALSFISFSLKQNTRRNLKSYNTPVSLLRLPLPEANISVMYKKHSSVIQRELF